MDSAKGEDMCEPTEREWREYEEMLIVRLMEQIVDSRSERGVSPQELAATRRPRRSCTTTIFSIVSLNN
ncbi:hypothetical protein PQR75_24805 [Paraburkholderia fungorum]|jgi:hypothetical protein|uniref:hypothetical protein n=1 Tax=Paraburkholderia fungorum TaxID=134537 RepID=UPI0038BB22BC